MQIQVECYAGHRGEETPRRFWLGEKKIEVTDVKDRWLSPDHRYFKILGTDQAAYILRHDTHLDVWEMVFFQGTGELAG